MGLSYTKGSGITFSDSPSLDSFGTLRTSNKSLLFEAAHHYGQLHHLFVAVVTNSGTVTDSPGTSSLSLSVTSTLGSRVINRSRRYYYVSGQSHRALMTFNFKATSTKTSKKVGFYDSDDGVYLQNVGGVVSIVTRTSTSGSPVETTYPQTSWNVDKMDGTGISGIAIDWTKAQLLEIDLQWFGVGRIRVLLHLNGTPYMVHEILNSNNQNIVYIQTANLPVTYEIETLISGGSGDSLDQICAAVYTEGDLPLTVVRKAISTDNTGVSCPNGVTTHILSIRPAELFKTRANKGMAIPLALDLLVTGVNPAHFEVLEDATLTTPTWAAQGDDNSMMEVCKGLGAAGISGGRIRDEGYAAAGGKGGFITSSIDQAYQIQIDPAGVPDMLTIVAFGVGGTAVVYAKLNWMELY